MPRRKKGPVGVDFGGVCDRALKLPGVEVGTSYGTAALKVHGKLLVRLKEDGETIVLRTDPAAREMLMGSAPEVFYITDHYLAYPYVLVRLAALDPDLLPDLLEHAWQEVAPRKLARGRRDPGSQGPRSRRPGPGAG
jgi:hypothetical protein